MSSRNLGAFICADILRSLLKRGKSIRNVIVFLLVWAAQEAATALFFQCPCYDVTPGNPVPHRRVSYAVLWILVPTVALWLIGMLLLDGTWRCLIGCRNRPRPLPDQCCSCFWKTIGESALAPMTWLVLILIDGTFVECAQAYTPSNCFDDNTTPDNMAVILDRNTEARWKSTIGGLCLALSLIIIYFFAVLCRQCCSSMSYYQAKYSEHVNAMETEAMEEAAREENYPIFKARWKALFHGGTDEQWTEASALPYSVPIHSKKAGFIYSQFHGMRFDNERTFMDSGYGPMRSDFVYFQKPHSSSQAPENLNNARANQRGLATSNSAEKYEQKKLKKPRKINVDPKEMDSDENRA